MDNKELLNELQIIINQTKSIASISPGSIDDIIFKKCYNAYKIIETNGTIDKIDIGGGVAHMPTHTDMKHRY